MKNSAFYTVWFWKTSFRNGRLDCWYLLVKLQLTHWSLVLFSNFSFLLRPYQYCQILGVQLHTQRTQVHYPKNTGPWKVKLWGIFQNPKPKEMEKTSSNIICKYLKSIHFYQMRRVWLNILACHAHFNFEIQFAII